MPNPQHHRLTKPIEPATRMRAIKPFEAVEVFKRTTALQAKGHDIISLGIGEPDFTAPAQVVETLQRAAQAGLSAYTPPSGLTPLREAIALYYQQNLACSPDPKRIVITSGASGALLLASLALINQGDEVLLPDPSYPANQNFILSAGGVPKQIPTTAENRYQPTAETVSKHWSPKTRGLFLASPSNPTGTSIDKDVLRGVIEEVRSRNGFVLMDEIYQGLYYDEAPQSALAIDDDVIIINSFSKYFHMTGWRLGWLIVPESLLETVDRLAASLAICAPSLAQHAAITCFEPDVLHIYEARRQSFKQRRDYLAPALQKLGLDIPAYPDGAFYIFADIQKHSHDSQQFAQKMLEEAGVAAIPGADFGQQHARTSLRFAYTIGLDRLQEAVQRLEKFLA